MAKRPLPPDQHSRDRIANDLDVTILVEAAAGTGKTTCLISRMVSLLREGKCKIDTMVAVTFTRKAAAELRTRFQLALQQSVKQSSGINRQRLAEALEQIERCFIATIHSFCARLLRERPVEAGIDPGFIELDETHDDQLRRQAWREHVATLIATDDPILPELERLGLKISPATHRSSSLATELDELGLEPAQLGPSFLRFAEFPDVEEWPAEPTTLPDLAPCIKELRAYAAHMESLRLIGDPGRDELMPKYNLIVRMAKRLELEQPAQLMEVLAEFEDEPVVVQRNWPGGKVQALEERDRRQRFADQIASPLLLAWREHRYEPVMRAIRPARDVYDRLRRERNALNFQDLLLSSVKLLRSNPQIRKYFRRRFTHLLVDEFQDTDPMQAEVMLLLTADQPTETNWQNCRPVAGSLFVVGDPKQSIYRFRRADILTYNKVRSIVQESGGEIIPLTANFRSTKLVIDWINGCFSNVFPKYSDAYSPGDRPLDVGRLDKLDAYDGVVRLLTPSLPNQEAITEFEADMVARTIRRAINDKWFVPRSDSERQQGLPDHMVPGDILIVSRYKNRLATYAKKLQQYDLPHSVTGGSVLKEISELRLLYICLAAVGRPDDQIALVAALRSELFGVADTVLYDFRRLGGRFSYYAEIPAGLSAEDASVLRDAFDRFQKYAMWLRRMPAAAAIERIADDLGLIARACAAEEGDAYAGGLLKAIELLRAAEDQLTIGDYVDALKRLVDQTEPRDGISVRPPLEMPVRVMNLHQCKGLEAPFVFLVDPSGDIEHNVSEHIDRSADQPRGYLAIHGLKRSKYSRAPLLAQPPGWSDLAAEEQRFLDAEDNRLLYVAATRAGVKLIISQREPKKNSKNFWRLFDDYLQSAPQLADPGSMSAPAGEPVSFVVEDWERVLESIDERWRAVLQPTYAVEAIKESTVKGGTKPHGAESGGAQWGDVLHTLLQSAMNCPGCDLDGLAIAALENVGLPITLAEEAVETATRVIASPLWQRALRGRRRLTEVPLAMLVSSHESSSGLPTVVRGVIDLVFLEEKGWIIVDYKSERVDAAELPALVSYYKAQVNAYAETWERIVGQKVIERGIFFTHSSNYVPIDP